MSHPKYDSYKDIRYYTWVKAQRCLICGRYNASDGHHAWHGRRNDYLAYPLCREHHSERHNKGVKWFEERYAVSVEWIVINYLSKYISEKLNGPQ